VYDVVNEDEYSDMVRQRQEDDWIVDDGLFPFCEKNFLLTLIIL
jgi:hypothetical protein